MTDLRHAGAVERWFGAGFARLHPALQALHRDGGRLSGPIAIERGTGFAGLLGAIALRRMGVDARQSHRMTVEIRGDADALHWSRRIDDTRTAMSVFRPVGAWPDGHWIETVGPFAFELGVEIVDGAWRWQPRHCRVFGWPLPRWLAPRPIAGKRVDGDAYRFDVRIDLPLLGTVLAWGGRLRIASGAPEIVATQ
jgi:hypothetical protein